MKIRFTATLAFSLAAIFVVGHVAFHYAQLPPAIALHFDWRGRPNGFASKETLLIVGVAAVSVLALLFWGVGRMQGVSPQYVNMPNKDYWLSGERREASMVFVTNWARWVLALVMALQAMLMTSVLHANLGAPVALGVGPLYETAAFFVALAAMIVWLYRRFPRPQ